MRSDGRRKHRHAARPLSVLVSAGVALMGIALLAVQPLVADPLLPTLPDSYFPIGVFYQPASASGTTTFDGWKARGVNTLIGYEPQLSNGVAGVSVDQYTTAAANSGLYVIREPSANPANDAAYSNLVAYLQPDEPETKGIAAATLQANYAAWKAAAPNLPVLGNFDGSRVLGFQDNLTKANYLPYLAGADWVASDVYPVTGWFKYNDLGAPGRAAATLQSWSGGKPSFAFIETSNQRLYIGSNPQWDERGVTPDELRVETWDAIIHGAKGIIYFTQSFNAFRYDATPLDVAQEMTRQNKLIAALGSVLNSSQGGRVSTVSPTNPALDATWRTLDGVSYLLVLNTSGDTLSSQVLTDLLDSDSALQVLGEDRALAFDWVDGNGAAFTDTFLPYQLHIYAEAPVGTVPVDLPEPTAAWAVLGCAGGYMCMRRGRATTRRGATGRSHLEVPE